MATTDKRISIFRGAAILVVIFVVGAAVLARLGRSTSADATAKVSLAKCLAEKGTKMYGAYWCPHCQNQKKEFGDGAEFLPYVECAERGASNELTQACKDQGVDSFPTWIFPDGSRVSGEQSLKDLADKSGCPWSS